MLALPFWPCRVRKNFAVISWVQVQSPSRPAPWLIKATESTRKHTLIAAGDHNGFACKIMPRYNLLCGDSARSQIVQEVRQRLSHSF